KTRGAVIGKQQQLLIEQQFGEWVPNRELLDVPFCWYDNHVNAMAVKRKKARVVVVLGQQFISRLMHDADYQPMRQSLQNWLSKRSASARLVRVDEGYTTGDVVVITTGDQFDVDDMHNKLKSGQNSAVIGYVNMGDAEVVRKLLEKLNIEFRVHNKDYVAKEIYLQPLIDGPERIPCAYMLQRHIDSWKLFRTERFENVYSWEEWALPATQLKLKELIVKYGRFMASIAPCDLRPYYKDPETLNAVLNYNMLLQHQTGDKITRLPGVTRNPGDVHPSAKPTQVTIKLNIEIGGNFFPTGAYAKPGEEFTWTVLDNTDTKYLDQFIRVNAQTDNLEKLNEMKRWPTVTFKRPLTANGKLATPHGGPVLLQLPGTTTITVRLENVYRHAWLDLRDPKSISAFDSELKSYSAVPWFMVLGDAMYTMLLTHSVHEKNSKDLVSSADYFDNCIKVMHNYRGTKFEDSRAEVFVSDIQPRILAAHSGYPFVGGLEWSDAFVMWNEHKKGEIRGILHELGHNLQVHPATLKNGVEVTNNVYQL
ncbi:hypothetical protein X801_08359, partial [Opisthorchis viverrini]